ncbi:MAG TPA: hypothetical protein VFQ37_03805 [Mycobacterium sp.]|nr:hypothetical protein [Mycobacterium sp.]
MRQILLRAVGYLAAWGIGLLMAAWVVPGVSVRAFGFIFAVLLFAVVQTALSSFILRLPYGYASMVMGSAGLIMTFVALGLASALTHGLCIRSGASWLATAVVVWLVTTIGVILLPDAYTDGGVRPT